MSENSQRTPATRARTTPRPLREEQAWREIGTTTFAPGLRWIIIAGFLGFIVIVPLLQLLLPIRSISPPEPRAATDSANSGRMVEVQVLDVSAPPEDGGVYDDFLMQAHCRLIATMPQIADGDLLVMMAGMEDRQILPAARLAPGDTIVVALRPWAEVAESHAGTNGSLLEGDAYLDMPRHFAQVQHVSGASEPSGADFLAVWLGRGSTLPPEHRCGILAGTVRAWHAAEGPLASLLAANDHLARRLALYESALDDSAIATRLLRSPVQGMLTALGVGNENAYVGRDGWLFYAPAVRALTGGSFLDPVTLARRARVEQVQADPIRCIVDFRDQLAARAIGLLVVPVPSKPSIHPEALAGAARQEALRNPAMPAFFAALAEAGVAAFDPAPLLMAAKAESAPYLRTDTHWTPQAMQTVAEAIATRIASQLPERSGCDWLSSPEQHHQFGDIATMLELPSWQPSITPETVTIARIHDAEGRSWSADPSADLLLLGDSFSNIYQLSGMGWGGQAGLAAQLARACGRPVDVLARNDAGAHASRHLLLDALRRDPHRLDGKRLVIWEFAERELALGDWQVLDLPSAPAPASATTCPGPAVGDADEARAAWAALAAGSEAHAILAAEDWLFLRAELRHLGHGPFWGEHAPRPDADPLRGIVDLHERLAALGIGLVLMPAPPRAVIYADRLFADLPRDEQGLPQRLDADLQDFYATLRHAGVTVVDLTQTFLAARALDATAGPVCCPRDTHWSPRGLALAAQAAASAIGDAEWLLTAEACEVHQQAEEELRYQGDLVDRLPGHPPRETSSRIRRLTTDAGGTEPLAFHAEGPVLLLADSHGLVFSAGKDMHATDAGLGEHLIWELGVPVDRMARRGSGDTVRAELARRFLTDPAAAVGKRVVIYTFAARTLTEGSNWKPVPLER